MTIRAQNGAVTVKSLRGPALTATHAVSTTYGGINFHWPIATGMSYSAESTYGSIRSDFPGTTREQGSTQSREGSSGNGTGTLNLVARNGSVHLVGE